MLRLVIKFSIQECTITICKQDSAVKDKSPPSTPTAPSLTELTKVVRPSVGQHIAAV